MEEENWTSVTTKDLSSISVLKRHVSAIERLGVVTFSNKTIMVDKSHWLIKVQFSVQQMIFSDTGWMLKKTKQSI